MSINEGVLYIVATPIGNRADMGQRAISILSEVDIIAAEDTRHSRHLLQHYNIKTHLLAYHDHNEGRQTPLLIEKLLSGQSIALISDAGTPLLSDPGYQLVKAAHQADIKVSPIPGPCAAIAALSASGMPTDRFYFSGFPPSKPTARQVFFGQLAKQTATLIFYESSHRIEASLSDMILAFGGDRDAILAREISKLFETIKKSTLQGLQNWIADDANQHKGEFVVIVGGETSNDQQQIAEVDIEQLLLALLDELPLKQASQLVAKITGIKKNQAYKMALKMKPN